VFDRRGIPRERLVEGFAVRLDYLERPSNRIDWDVFADLSAPPVPGVRRSSGGGNLEDEVARGLLAEGLRAVLRKPFGRAELAAVMERVLA
jgi:hypothetical protein